jgi:hypothetical protein
MADQTYGFVTDHSPDMSRIKKYKDEQDQRRKKNREKRREEKKVEIDLHSPGSYQGRRILKPVYKTARVASMPLFRSR